MPDYEQNHLESPWNCSYVSFLSLSRSEERFIADQREWQVDSIRIKSRFEELNIIGIDGFSKSEALRYGLIRRCLEMFEIESYYNQYYILIR